MFVPTSTCGSPLPCCLMMALFRVVVDQSESRTSEAVPGHRGRRPGTVLTPQAYRGSPVQARGQSTTVARAWRGGGGQRERRTDARMEMKDKNTGEKARRGEQER